MAKIKYWMIKVNGELDKKVKEFAKAEGGNVSTLVRRAVINHINAAQK